MAMVSNQFLGAVAVKLGFHKHLRHSGSLVGQIDHYAQDVQEAENQANGAKDYWTTTSDPPKV